MKTLEKILADNIIARREALGMSQKGLAKASGIVVQTINRYENGKQMPRFPFILAIAKALHCTKEDLFSSSADSKNVRLEKLTSILKMLPGASDSDLDSVIILLAPEASVKSIHKKA